MKFKTSKRAIDGNYSKVVSIGYCNAQHLLHFEEPIAYSSGQYGWACDYYDVAGVLISTGYSPIRAKNSSYAPDLLHNYDERAKGVLMHTADPEKQKLQIRVLLNDFLLTATHR